MNRKTALPAIALVLVGLWMVLMAQGAEDLAELYVTKIVLDPPSTVSRGEVVEVYARVMNTGTRSADGFNISFFYQQRGSSGSWALHGTIESVSLPPSQQDYYEATFYIDTMDMELGTYDLRIVADSANHITETDELNNELRTTMTIRDSSLGLPDLQPVSLSYTHTNPGAIDDMEPWNISTRIHNLGEVQAGQFVVAFLADDVEFARQIRFVLPAGATTDIAAELDPQSLGLDPGTHQISVVVDPEDELIEQNEGNNSVSGSLTLQSVELVPLSLAFDKSLVRLDEEVRISAEIRNDGEGVAKAVEVAFYAGHVRFASATIDILGRGMSATVEGILDPEKQGLADAPATYEIRVVIDPNDLLHEFDENNNEMIRTLTIHPQEEKQPELHPESIELSPASPAEIGRADSVSVTTTIRNTGRAMAEDFDVAFYYRVKGGLRWEPFLCSDAVSCEGLNLSPDMQSKHVGVLSVLFLTPGIYEVRVLVDPADAVAELDETNNELVTTLMVLASRLPDLSFCLEGAIVVEPSLQVHRGQTIRLNPCITNLGDQDAGPFSVRFTYCPIETTTSGTSTMVHCSNTYSVSYFSPGPEISVGGLAIGEKINVPILLETRDLAPGQYQILVEIDPLDAVRERNELNNALDTTRPTILGPDLAIVDLIAGQEGVVQRGEPVGYSATILNVGVTPAGGFAVGFQLLRQDGAGILQVLRTWSCDSPAGTVECGGPEFFGYARLPGLDLLTPELATCSLDTSGLEAGQYVVRAIADVEETVGEHNEANNVSVDLSLMIADDGTGTTDSQLPTCTDCVDLKVRSLSARLETGVQRTSRVMGTIENIGTVDAGPFTVTAYYIPARGADPITIVDTRHRTRYDGLAAGETATFRQDFDTSTLENGFYDVFVVVDVNNEIIESNEENNSKDEALWIHYH